MFDFDFFEPFTIECEGLGTLKPLTLAQMIEMRCNIRDDLFGLAKGGLHGEELAKAAAAVSAHVAGMNRIQQADMITNSPLLMVQAGAFMLGEKWGSGLAAQKIDRKYLPQIQKAVEQSYGVRFVKEDEQEQVPEAKKEPDPPEAATV